LTEESPDFFGGVDGVTALAENNETKVSPRPGCADGGKCPPPGIV
jgi:hypothetical protein